MPPPPGWACATPGTPILPAMPPPPSAPLPTRSNWPKPRCAIPRSPRSSPNQPRPYRSPARCTTATRCWEPTAWSASRPDRPPTRRLPAVRGGAEHRQPEGHALRNRPWPARRPDHLAAERHDSEPAADRHRRERADPRHRGDNRADRRGNDPAGPAGTAAHQPARRYRDRLARSFLRSRGDGEGRAYRADPDQLRYPGGQADHRSPDPASARLGTTLAAGQSQAPATVTDRARPKVDIRPAQRVLRTDHTRDLTAPRTGRYAPLPHELA